MIHQRFSEISVKFPRARFVCGSGPCEMSRISHTIHGTGIFTYIWLIFMVNVGKYTIRGSYGGMSIDSNLHHCCPFLLTTRWTSDSSSTIIQPTFKLKKLSLVIPKKKNAKTTPPFPPWKFHHVFDSQMLGTREEGTKQNTTYLAMCYAPWH